VLATMLAEQLEHKRAEQMEPKLAELLEHKRAELVVDTKMDSSGQLVAHSEQPECKRRAWEPRSLMEPAEWKEKVSSKFQFAPQSYANPNNKKHKKSCEMIA
jgi:hypothetical protein